MQFIRIGIDEAENLWKMQVKAFQDLYQKYHDTETSPASEALDKTMLRLQQPSTYYYYIVIDGHKVGAIRIVDTSDPHTAKRISPLFILPEYRNNGYAQKAIALAESIHGDSNWELETIAQEKGNCHLYEKMGYCPTGKSTLLNDNMTLVHYKKD